MKAGYVHILLIVDRSGSMENIKTETIEGMKTFIKANKEATNNEATISIVFFDVSYGLLGTTGEVKDVEFIKDFANLHSLELNETEVYVPRGGTNLLDAIGISFTETGKKLSDMPEESRPEKVAVAIITDGQENASRQFSKEKVVSMIKEQQEVYNWDISFISSDLSAIEEAKELGFYTGKTALFSKGKTFDSFSAVSARMSRAYNGGDADYSNDELCSMVD